MQGSFWPPGTHAKQRRGQLYFRRFLSLPMLLSGLWLSPQPTKISAGHRIPERASFTDLPYLQIWELANSGSADLHTAHHRTTRFQGGVAGRRESLSTNSTHYSLIRGEGFEPSSLACWASALPLRQLWGILLLVPNHPFHILLMKK